MTLRGTGNIVHAGARFRCLLALPFLLLTARCQAQSDSTAVPFRPSFSLGAGMFAFYGDVGNEHNGYGALVTRVAYQMHATAPITPWLEGDLFAIHGRVGVNERSIQRNLNFDSRITMGGFQLRYNFLQLLNPRRTVEPYVTVGFESIEFLTKTDLLDAQGRAYNYWSDGTIRDLPEDAPNAGDAQVIQRDYTYESDVREMNIDGFGRYPERTFGVPVGVGARMNIGDRFDFRLSTTMHFTLTDMIDGISEKSVGDRAGNARNDRVLYTAFSIGYTIDVDREKRRKQGPTLSPEEMDLLVLNDDEDQDRVPDMIDRCPHTPAGVPVDAFGCPLDGDGDGVPDHLDDEPDTPAGTPVNDHGVGLTDDDLLQAYLNYKDSANAVIVHGQVESIGGARRPPVKRRAERTYVVKVGSQLEGISEEMIQQILSIPDVRTVESGDTTYYVVGDYASLPEAVKRRLALGEQGIQGTVMLQENGRLTSVPGQGAVAGTEAAQTASGGAAVIRVQLGAYRSRIPKSYFKEVPDVVTITGDDGLTRYYSGSFTDVNQAARHKVELLLKGFDGAFLVAFKDGKRVSLLEAGAVVTGTEDLSKVPVTSINKEAIRFRVQVGTFAGNVPTDVMDQYIEVGNVTPVAGSDAVRYYYGSYSSRAAAEVARREVQNLGLADAFVVGEVNGHIISAEEAERLLNE